MSFEIKEKISELNKLSFLSELKKTDAFTARVEMKNNILQL